MDDDPQGHYATLGLASTARAAEIAAAFRNRARRLHPDVPVTGNNDAFVKLGTAYAVLGNPLRRAAYDREAAEQARRRRLAAARAAAERDGHYDFDEASLAATPDAIPRPKVRGPRLSDMPLPVWIGLLALLLLATVEAVRGLSAIPSDAPQITSVAAVTEMPGPAAPSVPVPMLRAVLVGPPTDYVLPAGGPVPIWHRAADGQLTEIGTLAPFALVSVIDAAPWHGMAAVRLAGGGVAYVPAGQLYPGSADEAHRAFCAYRAGVAPHNAEVLAHAGSGPAEGGAALAVENDDDRSAVLALDGPGYSAAVFLAPAGKVMLIHLPPGRYAARLALGTLWSRACGRFAAGMQARALAAPLDLAAGRQGYLRLSQDLPGRALDGQTFLGARP